MNLITINQYGSVPTVGYAGRVYYLSKYLARHGANVEYLFQSNHYLIKSQGRYPEVDGLFYRVCKLLPNSSSKSVRRIINWFLFGCYVALFRPRLKKVDYVFYSAPSLVGWLGAYLLSRRTGAKLILDIRDVWPATLEEIGGYSASSPPIKILRALETLAYKHSDMLTSNLPGFGVRLAELPTCRQSEFYWLPNGVDPEEYEKALSEAGRTELCNKVSSDEKFIIGYVGSLGLANAIEQLLDLAEKIQHLNVEFYLVGDGDMAASLQTEAATRGLARVRFTGPVSKSEALSFMSSVDLLVLAWKDSPLYRYGIGANKLSEYLWSGKPVINFYRGFDDPVEISGGGLSCSHAESQNAVNWIQSLMEGGADVKSALGKKAKHFAREHFDYEDVALRFLRKLESHAN